MKLINSCKFKASDIKNNKIRLFNIDFDNCLLMLFRGKELLSKSEDYNFNNGLIEFISNVNSDDSFVFEIYDISDKLDKIFNIQNEKSVDLLKNFEIQQIILAFTRALIHQTTEIDNCFPWKWWEKQQLNLEKAKIIIVNMMTTVISICNFLGMKSDDVFDMIKSGIQNNKKN